MIRRAERCLEAGADMIMIDADDVCEDADSLRADIIAKVIGRLGLEKTMFEASNARTSEWFIKCYGPKVWYFFIPFYLYCDLVLITQNIIVDGLFSFSGEPLCGSFTSNWSRVPSGPQRG